MSSYANPQSLNRFDYVLNNPLRYTDPTGHKETECASQNDPLCSAVNGGSTGNTNADGGNGNGKNKGKHGNDPGEDIISSDANSLGGGKPLLRASALPPSPFACGWVDCGLSVASFLASAATEVPEWIVPAMIVDAAATGIAVIRTNADYAEGRITRVHQLSLNITAGLGFIPGHVGVAFSFINVLVTGSGYPQ